MFGIVTGLSPVPSWYTTGSVNYLTSRQMIDVRELTLDDLGKPDWYWEQMRVDSRLELDSAVDAENWMGERNKVVLVATQVWNGVRRIVGMLVGDYMDYYVDALQVGGNMRGSGVGTRLLERFVYAARRRIGVLGEWTYRQGLDAMIGLTTELIPLSSARKFYQKIGFKTPHMTGRGPVFLMERTNTYAVTGRKRKIAFISR